MDDLDFAYRPSPDARRSRTPRRGSLAETAASTELLPLKKGACKTPNGGR